MTAKEYLELYLAYDRKILTEANRLEEGRASLLGLSQALQERVQQSRCLDASQRRIDACLENEKKFATEIRRLRRRQAQIARVVFCIPDPTLQEVIRLRYLKGRTWSDIATQLLYEDRQLYRLHNKALDEVGRILAISQKLRPLGARADTGQRPAPPA